MTGPFKNILKGVGSVMDVGSSSITIDVFYPFGSEVDALRSDMNSIGADYKKAIKIIDDTHVEESQST